MFADTESLHHVINFLKVTVTHVDQFTVLIIPNALSIIESNRVH